MDFSLAPVLEAVSVFLVFFFILAGFFSYEVFNVDFLGCPHSTVFFVLAKNSLPLNPFCATWVVRLLAWHACPFDDSPLDGFDCHLTLGR